MNRELIISHQALADARKAVGMNPNWGEGYYRMGRAYLASQDYGKAEEAYQEGLRVSPSDPNLLQGIEIIRRTFTKSAVREAMVAGKQCFSRLEYVAAVTHFTR